MNKNVWAGLALAIIAGTAQPAQAQVGVPLGCTTNFVDVGVPVGALVQVWATGEISVHTYQVHAPAGVYSLVIEKHPTVAAVVMVDGREIGHGGTVRLARPGVIHVLAGAELTWQDIPGTCYGFQWELVRVVRATARRSAR